MPLELSPAILQLVQNKTVLPFWYKPDCLAPSFHPCKDFSSVLFCNKFCLFLCVCSHAVGGATHPTAGVWHRFSRGVVSREWCDQCPGPAPQIVACKSVLGNVQILSSLARETHSVLVRLSPAPWYLLEHDLCWWSERPRRVLASLWG